MFPFRGERGKPSTDASEQRERRAGQLALRRRGISLLATTTMAEPGPSKSRILAALDLTEDASSPPPSLPAHLLSQPVGEKRRKRGADASALAVPLNKRQTGTTRAVINRLPAGLLANTQSPGAYLHFFGLAHKLIRARSR